VTIQTVTAQLSLMRIFVAGHTGSKRKPAKNLFFMTGQASNISMRPFQWKSRSAVIKDGLFERSIGGMAAFTIRQTSAMRILVTRLAICL
jgi:hypothetical protein